MFAEVSEISFPAEELTWTAKGSTPLGEQPHGYSGMGYLDLSDLSAAHAWIWTIAFPEMNARSLTPGYSTLFGSRHSWKQDKIMSYGGSALTSSSNHRTVPARRSAESIASGSVMFRRIQQTQRALSAFCFRRSSKFIGSTSSAPPVRNWWFAGSVKIVGSNVCLYLRTPWTNLRLAFPRVLSTWRSWIITRCPTFLPIPQIPDTMLEGEISKGGGFIMVFRTRRYAKTNPSRANFQVTGMKEITLGADRPGSEFRDMPLSWRVRRVRKAVDDTLASIFWTTLWSRGARRAHDAGVWNGHSYDDVPAITIPT